MYQPKVSTTQKHSDSQGEHIVCEGKLLLLDKLNLETYAMKGDLAKGDKTGKLYIHNGGVLSSKKIYAIIISETEEIEAGDWVYNRVSKHSSTDSHIYQITRQKQLHNSNQYKILALPEHFSDKHLQAIVDGKMKDGDKVLIKCIRINDMFDEEPEYEILCNKSTQNHITLFPAKQSLEEVFEEWYEETFQGYYNVKYDSMKKIFLTIFKEGAKWAVKNNYKGDDYE